MRPIDADQLKLLLSSVSDIVSLDLQPTLDVEPRIQAEWVRTSPLVDSVECSHCRYSLFSEELVTPRCPWCGAHMKIAWGDVFGSAEPTVVSPASGDWRFEEDDDSNSRQQP